MDLARHSSKTEFFKFEVKTRKIPFKESACACLLGLMEALACCIGLRSYNGHQRVGNERQNF